MNNCLILDGREVAQASTENLLVRVKKLNGFGRAPKLVAVLVGDDPASNTYVNMKEGACHSLGIETEIKRLSKDTSTAELIQIIIDLNHDEKVDGILLQHPVLYPAELLALVGAAGFEPATTWSQTRCATRLRYAPKKKSYKLCALNSSIFK